MTAAAPTHSGREAERGSPPSRRRSAIPLPAPLVSSPPAAFVSTIVALPKLRWAARCDDGQFEGGRVASHAHSEPELVFCVAGRIRIDVQGTGLEGDPGDLIVLPAVVPHTLESDGTWENVCVLYSDDSLLDTRPRTIPVGSAHPCGRWLADLCRLFDSRPRTPGPVADALLLAILSDIAELERRQRTSQSLHPRLAVAVEYLEERKATDVSAPAIARATSTSYSHLSALFRERFGCAPLEYHRMKRMERARNLLLDPYLTVAEVARQVGFDDPGYFIRVFRRTVGVAPNRWRKDATQAPARPSGASLP